MNCSNDLKKFANVWPSASNFKCFSRSLEQFFLTVGQNNFSNKIPFILMLWGTSSGHMKNCCSSIALMFQNILAQTFLPEILKFNQIFTLLFKKIFLWCMSIFRWWFLWKQARSVLVLWMPREEITFTAWPKINSQNQSRKRVYFIRKTL